MSEVKVNKISPRANCGTVTLGDSGDSFVIPSGATITNNGTQTGFGRTGTVDWQTSSIKTSTFTAANGEGYFADTSSGGFTMNLPAGTAGNIVSVVDYTNTFQTNNLTITPNGSEKIGGVNASATLSTEGQSVTLVYVDSTEGWKNVQDSTSNAVGQTFVAATVSGCCNTLTTAPDCANVKIATFVNPGTFNVTSIATNTAENTLGYMVVGGGGAGGAGVGSGGGAGGFREGRNVPIDNFTASPLVANAPTNAITVSVTPYPITVGGGGAGAPDGGAGGSGANSVFSSITSAGGGGGYAYQVPAGSPAGVPGGSGGGATYIFPGSPGPHTTPPAQIGVGNTPPVTPPQGNPGGLGGINWTPFVTTGGGGGAGANGGSPGGPGGGPGGAGVSSSITGSSVARAGGGGGGVSQSGSGGSGGTGGGGAGGNLPAGAGTAGTANTGGGSGGSADKPGVAGVNGGSGIVVIRYKFQ